MVTVCTVSLPQERPRIDAAGEGCFTTWHADSLREVLGAARTRRVDALIISLGRCGPDAFPALQRFVREFPAIPAVALVARHTREATETLLRLGASGVRAAVDCTEPDGWNRLRELVGHPASPVVARILGRLVPALPPEAAEVRLFFELLTRLAPVLATARAVARHLQIPVNTLGSRFSRAGVPSLKRYLAQLRLVHAAYLLENPNLTVADVAQRLEYSSSRACISQMRASFGVAAREFRRCYPLEVALARYIDRLITPYREALRTFRPLHAGFSDQGPDVASVSRAG